MNRCRRCVKTPWRCRTCGTPCCDHLCDLKQNDGTALCGYCSRLLCHQMQLNKLADKKGTALKREKT